MVVAAVMDTLAVGVSVSAGVCGCGCGCVPVPVRELGQAVTICKSAHDYQPPRTCCVAAFALDSDSSHEAHALAVLSSIPALFLCREARS